METPMPLMPSLEPQDDALRKAKRNARDRQRSALKRETMASMRRQVAALEREKQRLERTLTSPSSPTPSTSSDSSSSSTEPSETHAGQQRYLEVLQQLEHLRRANREMALEVLRRDLFRSAVQNLLDTMSQPTTDKDAVLDEEDGDVAPSMPMEDAQAFASDAVAAIVAARRESVGMRTFSGAQVFGWSDFRLQTGTSIRFTIQKSFRHQSAARIAATTWTLLSESTQIRKLLPPNLQCDLRIVQSLPGDAAVVIDRTTTDPQLQQAGHGAVRTTYMLVRASEDAQSHAIGMKTIDLPAYRSLLRPHEVWCDIFYWIHVEDADDDTTIVRFGGVLSYVNEFIARAWLAELVFLAIRWETVVVAPVLLPLSQSESQSLE